MSALGVVRGRVWAFGDDVDTDVMAPWSVITRPFEERRSQVLHTRPEFARDVRPGDLIVAGRILPGRHQPHPGTAAYYGIAVHIWIWRQDIAGLGA